MEDKKFLKWCKVFRGESEYPYPRDSKDNEYKYVLWLNERVAIRECISENIHDDKAIIELINKSVLNGLSMYHNDWAIGMAMSEKTLGKIQEYDMMPFLG